jgi:hypothetical protein
MKNTTKYPQKSLKKFCCETCNYFTSSQKDYNKHILTAKHKNTTNNTEKNDKISFICECGKSYAYRGSLYNHKKKCKFFNKEIENTCQIINNEISDQSTLINKLIDENLKLQDQISELIPKVGNTVINNKFDLNIFLNEDCKDALTINEFIDKIKITLEDLSVTKNKGIANGVSNIFIENIKKLSVHERPLHCIDIKNETFYIKSNVNNSLTKWFEDSDNKLFKEAIRKVGIKQTKKITDWVNNHPEWENKVDEQKDYLLLIKNCTDEIDEKKEEKIIKNISNTVHLNN